VPPATPNGVSLLRCSICAVHTRQQLEHMIEVMTGIGRQMGIISGTPKLRVIAGAR
jgi:8-amino-7-oxononanoate synthase